MEIMETEEVGSRVVFQIISRTIAIIITTTTTKTISTRTIINTIKIKIGASATKAVGIIIRMEVVVTTTMVAVTITTMVGEEDIIIIMQDIRTIMAETETAMLVLTKEVTTIQIIGNTIKPKESKIISKNKNKGSIQPNSISIGVKRISNSKIIGNTIASHLSTKPNQCLQVLSTLPRLLTKLNNI